MKIITKNTRQFLGVRIPKGFVLRVPHGGKPELRSLAVVAPASAGTNERDTDPVKRAKRRCLMEKAGQLGMKEAIAFGQTWSLERLEGAVFDRYCLWADAKRAGVRRTNRRWSDSALYDAMLRLKLLGR